jgi:hypothetical protein
MDMENDESQKMLTLQIYFLILHEHKGMYFSL